MGLLFILSAFVPLAGYHLESTDIPVWGTVWNFMLPTGWFSIIAGVCLLLLSKRSELKNKWLALAIFTVSISLLIVFFLQDADYFIGLWLGTKGDFDLEGQIAVPFFLGIAGIFSSLVLMTMRSKPELKS